MVLVRGAFILLAIYAAVRLFLEIHGGSVRVGEGETPSLLVSSERPFAFWSLVTFFYLILAAMIASAALLP